MLLNDGSQFPTREEYEVCMREQDSPEYYSFDDYLADCLNVRRDYTLIVDALIAIIDELQSRKVD